MTGLEYTDMSLDAHLWFAPGVEVFAGTRVPDPPPRSYRVMVEEPMTVDWTGDYSPLDCPAPQLAEFTLSAYGRGGEVAHYDLASRPPTGWRWLCTSGRIHAEKPDTTKSAVCGSASNGGHP